MARNETKMETQENDGTGRDQRDDTKANGIVDRLKAYRTALKKRGKLMEAQAVDRCIEIVSGKP